MALTNAERQARLRARRKGIEAGNHKFAKRLDVWLDEMVRMHLDCLSVLKKQTIREIVEHLIEKEVEAAKAHNYPEWLAAYGIPLEEFGDRRDKVNEKRWDTNYAKSEAIRKEKQAARAVEIELEQLKKHVTG